jgi:glycosyltransferase involved in cell wall biosynthesis
MEFLKNIIDSVSSRLDIHFVLVGQGPYEDRFKEQYDDDTVHVEGYVDYSRIDRYYKSADVYVHPSPLEGIPLVILEALSCGVPVLARDAGDIEFVTGTVYDSVEGIAQAIVSRKGSAEWHNKRYFTPKYQGRTIRRLVTTLFDDSS